MKNVYTFIKNSIKHYTVIQWRKIDEEYKTEDLFNLKAASVFITAAAVLIISEYVCRAEIYKLSRPLYYYIQRLEYPQLWMELYWALSTALNYFLLPALVIKFIFKERIRDYGFKIKNKPGIYLLYLIMFILVFPFVYTVSFSPAFLNKYPFYKDAARTFGQLIMWEAGYGTQFFMLEFFFRGFLLFSMARYIGAYAIFVMVIPYSMIHFTKPVAETIGAVITGITLGTLALRTHSLYGGIIIHVAVAWSMDLLSLYNKGQLQKLFR
ncbi:MAG: type II CAAX endopeptidase family protein [Spirochaetota bacterium]